MARKSAAAKTRPAAVAADVQRRRGPKPTYARELLAALEQVFALNWHLDPIDVAKAVLVLYPEVGGGGTLESRAVHLLRRARAWIVEDDTWSLRLWFLLTPEGQDHHYVWRAKILRRLRKRREAEQRYGAERVAAWLLAHPEHNDLIFSDYEESISACLSRLGMLMMVES